ncbi:PAS domain-containing protein, partial [Halobellus sp. Atlit-31R]
MTPQRRLRRHAPRTAVLVLSFLGGYCAGQAAAALRRARYVQRPAHAFDGRRIVHSASDAILSIDEHAIILFANPAAAQMFASSVAAMQGSSLARFIQPPLGEANSPYDYFPTGGGRAGRRATDYAVTGIRANGQLFPIEGSISTVEHDGHEVCTV